MALVVSKSQIERTLHLLDDTEEVNPFTVRPSIFVVFIRFSQVYFVEILSP